jgi:hypothetical protein
MEMVHVLRNLNAAAASGGPCSEIGGVFWVDVPEAALGQAQSLFPRLGYTVGIDLPVPAHGGRSARSVRWRKRYYELHRIYEEQEETYRSQAPDCSEFLLAGEDGTTRRVRGYRGNSQPGQRRGLPVCDARLLVNLVSPSRGNGRLLDPFAGAGSVVRHAVTSGLETYSTDIDPRLALGLADLGSCHCVADARQLPFPAGFFDAIATEPPYDQTEGNVAAQGIPGLSRLLKSSGRMSMLLADWQTEEALMAGEQVHMKSLVSCRIDRKGLACTAVVWEKEGQQERCTATR